MAFLGFGRPARDRVFRFDQEHPLAQEHLTLEQHLDAGIKLLLAKEKYPDHKDTELGREILSSAPDQTRRYAMALLERLQHNEVEFVRLVKRGNMSGSEPVNLIRHLAFQLMQDLLRKKIPFSEDDIQTLLNWFNQTLRSQSISYLFPDSGIVKALKDYSATDQDTSVFVPIVRKIDQAITKTNRRDLRKLGNRLMVLVGAASPLSIKPGEAWSDAALSFYNSRSEPDQEAWSNLLIHCASANGGKPSKKWTETGQQLLDQVSSEAFADAVEQWFPLVDKPRTEPILEWPRWAPDPNGLIAEDNADVLKGLAWLTGICADPATANPLSEMATSAYRKVPGVGPRASKVGNACVWALGQIPDDSALAALAILKVRVKFKPAQKGISNALAVAAERAGLTPQELEEIGVPTYGMTSIGVRTEQVGEYQGQLSVTNGRRVELTWINSSGKSLKSVPKAIKEQHGSTLSELRQASKDITKMLSAQRERLDNFFLEQRQWPYQQWRERYLDHPLIGALCRHLIWSFGEPDRQAAGLWLDGAIVDAQGQPLAGLNDTTPVRLWHPINDETYQVQEWRNFIEGHAVVQPFKQAHREIYLLTPAEEATESYSNRYASHIIKQHQFNALCAARGWQSSLRLMVDGEYAPPTRELPQWGVRAEFWVEGIGDNYDTDVTESGSYLWLATDQVRFYPTEAGRNSAHAAGGGYITQGTDDEINQPLPLRDINPLVLSEVFRDVDLFVGVTSVGNDPNWSDGGPTGRFVEYWNSYSFGELGESAITRKVLLERLLPKLKISDRCQLEDRFLIVRGDIRTYKIHLGSSNILMEPNNQYLCIVQSQSKHAQANKVFLPFEGDNRLALILSKAFLLADDKKIKDKTILQQLAF